MDTDKRAASAFTKEVKTLIGPSALYLCSSTSICGFNFRIKFLLPLYSPKFCRQKGQKLSARQFVLHPMIEPRSGISPGSLGCSFRNAEQLSSLVVRKPDEKS